MKKWLLFILVFPTLSWAGMNPYIFGIVPADSSGGVFLSDVFTEASVDTTIASHDPETGGAWSANTYLEVVASTDILHTTDNATVKRFSYNDATPPSADYSVTVVATLNTTNTNNKIMVLARWTSADSGYTCTINANGARGVELYTNGSWVSDIAWESGSFTDFAVTTEYTFVLTVADDYISCEFYEGLTLRSTVGGTDAGDTYPLAGYAGVGAQLSNPTITSIEAE